MECKLTICLVLLFASPLTSLRLTGHPYYVPKIPKSSLLPSNYITSNYQPFILPTPYQAYGVNTRVICSACSCDDDFFCAFNCPKCSTDSFCSSCNCRTSLGCARNCASCQQPAQDQPQQGPSSCVASSGSAAGKKCIFPFIFNGVQYEGCAPYYAGGVVNLYSPTFWCSTKVDVNGYHVRGPYNDKGKHVGFCDDTCPKVSNRYFY